MGYLDNTGLAYFWGKIKSNFFPGTKLIPGNSDLNGYRTPGVYYCPSNTTTETIDNMPVHLAFSLMVLRTTGNGCRQIFMPYSIGDTNENTNRIWSRAFYDYDGGWSDWCQIVTSMDRPIEYTSVGCNSSGYSDSKMWHKVATFPYTRDYSDRRAVFTVTDSFNRTFYSPYGSVDLKYGILHVHIHRTNDFTTSYKTTKLTWNLITGYNVDDFVLVHIPSTNALELWTRVPNRWNFRTFNLVENANISGGNRYKQRSFDPIEMRGRVDAIGQESYPTGDGYTVIKSEAAVIEQPSRGLLDLGVCYNKLDKSRLTTAYNFEAGTGLLEYFNSAADMTVENGSLTRTDDISRYESHMLRMPWDYQNGFDSILAIPAGTSTYSNGSMDAMAWRTGIGPTGVTTDENGIKRATAYTDWFHLIDDRFTIDGVHIKKQHTTHYGVCSTAAATAVKTVDIPNFELVTGAYVIVKFTVANSAAVANLKLNVSNTGDIPIKYRNSNVASAGDLIANRPFLFVYDGTNWQLGIDIDKNTNNYERVRTYYPIKAKSAITKQHVIVAGEDGLYFMLTSGSPFSIKYPPLYATADISANAKDANAYYFAFLDAAVITNEAAETLVLNKALYIKGHLNGTTFTPFATKSLVCTEPTTEDGYQYLKLGVVKAQSNTDDTLRGQIEMEHPIYEYVNGSFCLYEPKATDAEIDALFN